MKVLIKLWMSLKNRRKKINELDKSKKEKSRLCLVESTCYDATQKQDKFEFP